jgi:acyl-CoA synthetase (AMP-forming)/AMP-acid ligase II
MRLVDFLDKGASLHPDDAPCLTMAGQVMRYADVQRLSWSVGRALARSGIRPGDKVAVLSGNDPVAFGSVFGISRAGAVWCPVNPRSEAAENRELPRAARLPLPDLRRRLRAARREDRAGPAGTAHAGLPGRRSRGAGRRRRRVRRVAGRGRRRAVAGRAGR